MANANAPFGFRPTRHIAGGTPGRLNGFSIASGYNTDIFMGDPVTRDGSDGIVRASNATGVLGIFQGVNFIAPDGSVQFQPYWKAGTTIATGTKVEALVNDDEFQLYMVQTSGTLAETEVGLLVNMDLGTAGDPSTGNSRAAVTGAAGSENQFLVERIIRTPVRNAAGMVDESQPGQYAIVEVSIAKSARALARVVPASTEI